MHESLANLTASFEVVPIGDGLYRGDLPGWHGPHLFGGQALAQGLAAANRFVEGALANSFHAYFLSRGNAHDPVEYSVEGLRASRSFHTLAVTARQAGKRILALQVSYHVEEPGPVHQIPMDEVGPPTGDYYERALLQVNSPDDLGGIESFELPVEIRGVGGIGLFDSEIRPPQARFWLRARDPLPDDPSLHQCLFAYSSDYPIMAPAFNPHPHTVKSLQTASLDHAIWFHQRFRMDEWLLFELDSPVAHGARSTGRGLLYSRDGSLVASCVQESLVRPIRGATS